jgi:glyoxylase-like metal-dependent hydrolase (beta-lactamase superfamily II)
MKKYITTIKLGGSEGNCYLIKTSNGYILIITGEKSKHRNLEEELEVLNISSENLDLIIFTHCNLSVCTKYAGLCEKFNTKTAMHVLSNSIDFEDKTAFYKIKDAFSKKILNLSKTKKFKPDLIIDEGYNLSEFGLNARVIYMPGFTDSSIGILTENGELFCDDVFIHNMQQNDNEKYNLRFLRNLKNLFIDIIYPGRGEPLPLNSIEA